MHETYIYGEMEVRKTGRVARKTLVRPDGKAGREFILYEITPVSEDVGVWKKWVKIDELFLITEEE